MTSTPIAAQFSSFPVTLIVASALGGLVAIIVISFAVWLVLCRRKRVSESVMSDPAVLDTCVTTYVDSQSCGGTVALPATEIATTVHSGTWTSLVDD
jgi:hypothetical protein